MAPDFDKAAAVYRTRWKAMVIDPVHQERAAAVAKTIIDNKDLYDAVENITGVPWHWLGCIHYREADLNFHTHLANGDPLGRPTRDVPRGLLARTWTEGAEQAIEHENFMHLSGWDNFGHYAYRTEAYNGWGYALRRVSSSYLWAGSNQHDSGKFTADGTYSPSAVDGQLGTMVVLKALMDQRVISFTDL